MLVKLHDEARDRSIAALGRDLFRYLRYTLSFPFILFHRLTFIYFFSSQLYSLCLEHMSDSPSSAKAGSNNGSADGDDDDPMMHSDSELIRVRIAVPVNCLHCCLCPTIL